MNGTCLLNFTWLVHRQEANENFEDASNELILTDEEVVRFQIGEIFAHVPKDEVETRIEKMQETTAKHLEKLQEEKESILSQMADLKKILYAKFKESINLEEDWSVMSQSFSCIFCYASCTQHVDYQPLQFYLFADGKKLWNWNFVCSFITSDDY